MDHANRIEHATAFLDWLRTQPPEETYSGYSPKLCALGQYAASRGWHYIEEHVAGSTYDYFDSAGVMHDFEQVFGVFAIADIIHTKNTFGALADRVEQWVRDAISNPEIGLVDTHPIG